MIFYSGKRDDQIQFTNGINAGMRSKLMKKAIENQEKIFTSNYRKALNPGRKLARDDEGSLQLARYLERIN